MTGRSSSPSGSGWLGQRAGEEPAHLEPEPDRDEALVAEQRPVRPLDVERPGAERPLAGTRIGRRLSGEAGAGRAVERGADAPVPVLRQDGAPALERRARSRAGCASRTRARSSRRQLGDQEVAADVEPRRGLVVGAERVGTEDLVHAVGSREPRLTTSVSAAQSSGTPWRNARPAMAGASGTQDGGRVRRRRWSASGGLQG